MRFRVAKTHNRYDHVKLNRNQTPPTTFAGTSSSSAYKRLNWVAKQSACCTVRHLPVRFHSVHVHPRELIRKPNVNKPNVDSPFLKQQPRRLSFSSILILLLMVVFAGMGLLIYNALNVPAITNELDAWLGRQSKTVETADSRKAQIIFVMFCYSAPLMLGILVHALHGIINFFDRRQQELDSQDDEAFRMTD